MSATNSVEWKHSQFYILRDSKMLSILTFNILLGLFCFQKGHHVRVE